MKLWDKGISIDKQIEKFTVGNDRELDMHLAEYDIQASKAHAKMLGKVGILEIEEVDALVSELDLLKNQLEKGQFEIEEDFEGSMIPGVARFYAGFGANPETYFQLKFNRLPLPLRWIKR